APGAGRHDGARRRRRQGGRGAGCRTSHRGSDGARRRDLRTQVNERHKRQRSAMRKAVIVDYVRSPFTPANRGELQKVRPDEFAGQVVKALIERTGVAPEDIEDLIMGCAFPEAEQGLNVGRIAVFLAGLPKTVPGATINRFCGSSMTAIHTAAGAIACGAGDAFVCAGVESMSRVPMTGFNPMPHPGL